MALLGNYIMLDVVWKKNGKWQVCMDFTNLNKACLKHSFSFLKIDILVDATVGHEHLSFIDVNSGCNQIMIHPNN